MQDRLEELGGNGERILFAHDNGYPPVVIADSEAWVLEYLANRAEPRGPSR